MGPALDKVVAEMLDEFKRSTAALEQRKLTIGRDVVKIVDDAYHKVADHMKPGLYALDYSDPRHKLPEGHDETENEWEDERTEEEDSDEDADDEYDVKPDASKDSYMTTFQPKEHEAYVDCDGEFIAIWDWLGEEYSEIIESLHSCRSDDKNPVPGLLTDLRDHQITGVKKIQHLTAGPFRGGILGDEMGLGKTLTTIVACMASKPYTRGCFDLVVTTRTCIMQWVDELKFHFDPQHRPSYFVLDNPHMGADELLDGHYDFVLCTYQFLESCYRARENYKNFFRLVEKHGLREAGRLTREKTYVGKPVNIYKLRRRNGGLFSELFKDLKLPFRHLILDEAQFIKNYQGSTHAAAKALYYEKIIMLSGTFVPNKWYEIFGLLDLLPCHPFNTVTKFMTAFGSKIDGSYRGPPSRSKHARLIKFLQGVVVARPSSILNLPGMSVTICSCTLGEEDSALVAYYTQKFRKAIRQKDPQGTGATDVTTNSRKLAALAAAQRAQQVSNNRMLLPQGDQDQINREHFIAEGRSLLPRFEKHDDSLQGPEMGKKDSFMKFWTATVDKNESLGSSTTDAGSSPDSISEAHPDGKEQEDSLDEEEVLWTTSASGNRKLWLADLPKRSNADLLSPKVEAIIKQIKEIRRTYPGEKIVIFSRFLKFLDILEEALKRDRELEAVGVSAIRFDGTTSFEDRRIRREQFIRSDNESPLLITAGAGGAGMNLAQASHVIQCETWWNGNEERQAYGRCWRSGQTKHVHVYKIVPENSAIDCVMMATNEGKLKVNDPITEKLRHTDDEMPIIPEQYIGTGGEI